MFRRYSGALLVALVICLSVAFSAPADESSGGEGAAGLVSASDDNALAATDIFSPVEVELHATGNYANPYTDCTGEVVFTQPDGRTARTAPLFWDGGKTWKFRFAPDRTGPWKWTVSSADAGLDGQLGEFECQMSKRRGSIRAMRGFPHHFECQDGSPFWFMGDTAWSLYTDSTEKHDRDVALEYLDARATQGFNVVHSMLMCESGDGNSGGPPFTDIATEKLNPAYWREVDLRLAHANRCGIVAGLALAWGNKRNTEKWPWGRFPGVEARQRYARYIAARYSAYDVYFIVSGEWHAEVRNRRGATEDSMRREFITIGDALHAADPHGRMVAIHPMTAEGSVREFNAAKWMTFGDYQQNYTQLHARVHQSRRFNKPVVNSEYGYYLRDRDGDGVVDKPNSHQRRRDAGRDLGHCDGGWLRGDRVRHDLFGGTSRSRTVRPARREKPTLAAADGTRKTIFHGAGMVETGATRRVGQWPELAWEEWPAQGRGGRTKTQLVTAA